MERGGRRTWWRPLLHCLVGIAKDLGSRGCVADVWSCCVHGGEHVRAGVGDWSGPLTKRNGFRDGFDGLRGLSGALGRTSPKLIGRCRTAHPPIFRGIGITVPLGNGADTDCIQGQLVGHFVPVETALLRVVAFSPADPVRAVDFLTKGAGRGGVLGAGSRDGGCIFVGINHGVDGGLDRVSG